MKQKLHLFLVLTALLILFAASGCAPIDASNPGGLIVGQSYRLPAGETLDQGLVIIGGSAVLEKDSAVNGDVDLIGGSLVVNGTINGNISAIGGVVSLGDLAQVKGDVDLIGANLSRSEKAVIQGTIGLGGKAPSLTNLVSPRINAGVKAISNVFGRIFQAFALGALAVLVSLFALKKMETTSDALKSQPLIAGGVGLLTLVVVPALLLVMLITIILSPLSLIGLLALVAAYVFGWIVVGMLTGQRLAALFNQQWSAPISAGIGTVALSLVSSLFSIIPCIGWIAPFLITIAGLGSVALTRFGFQVYPSPELLPAAVTPAAPGDPQPPTPQPPQA